MSAFRQLALNLDAAANIAVVAGSLLLLNAFGFEKQDDLQVARQSEWGTSQASEVAAAISSTQSTHREVTALAPEQASVSSVAGFMRAPAIPTAAEPNLSALDPNFHEKVRSPSPSKAPVRTARTPLASTSGPITLPWKDVEPVRFRDNEKDQGTENRAAAGDKSTALPLPSTDLLTKWVKANTKTFKGSDRTRSLVHFELWLDAPEDVKRRMSSVEYDLRAGAVQPRQRVSKDANAGFRAGFGGFACAREIVVTIHFDDGRSQTIEVDGCALMASNGIKNPGS